MLKVDEAWRFIGPHPNAKDRADIEYEEEIRG